VKVKADASVFFIKSPIGLADAPGKEKTGVSCLALHLGLELAGAVLARSGETGLVSHDCHVARFGAL
jgi:hypothetical protein